jgi:hypothetical protein
MVQVIATTACLAHHSLHRHTRFCPDRQCVGKDQRPGSSSSSSRKKGSKAPRGSSSSSSSGCCVLPESAVNLIMHHLVRSLEPGGLRGPGIVARDIAAAAQVNFYTILLSLLGHAVGYQHTLVMYADQSMAILLHNLSLNFCRPV